MPRSRFSAILVFGAILRCTGVRVFLIDNRNDAHPTGEIKDAYVVHYGPDLDLRWLHYGSKYRVVEVFYEPKELRSLLGHQGWTVRPDATRWFIFGEARLAEGGAHAGPDASYSTR